MGDYRMEEDLQILEKKVHIFNELYQKYKKKNSIDEIELKEILCDILSWMEICIKKVKNTDNTERKIISGIKYVNNLKKHSTSIFKYNLSSYALFPSKSLYPSPNLYPSDFNIWWNSLPLDNSDYENQYRNYNKYLKDKELYKTINDIYMIIKQHYIIEKI